MNHSSFVSVSKAHIGTGPHRALEPGTIGRVPDDVILRRCDAQEVQVIRARGAGPRLRRVIQHPNVILTQEGILCRNKQKKNPQLKYVLQEIVKAQTPVKEPSQCLSIDQEGGEIPVFAAGSSTPSNLLSTATDSYAHSLRSNHCLNIPAWF